MPTSDHLASEVSLRPSIGPVPTAPIRPTTDGVTPAPPLLDILPPDAPRRASTPAALSDMQSTAAVEFIESAERYTHSDWAREERSGSVCDAAIRNLLLGIPLVLPNDSLLQLESCTRPPLSEARYLPNEGRLYTDDDNILLLARKITPPALACSDEPGGRAARLFDDEPMRIYTPLLVRP